MLLPVSNATTFEQIVAFYESLSEQDLTERIIPELAARFANDSTLNEVVNITNGAPPLTWLVIDAVQCYGRGSDFGCEIARGYLRYIYDMQIKLQLPTILELCQPYSHKDFYQNGQKALVPAVFYHKLGLLFRDFYENNKTNSDSWRLIFFITAAIHKKDIREDSSWFEAAKSFFVTFIFETFLSSTIPNIELHDRGVRHDMYCPVSGTHDPDFYYTSENGRFTAEFKRALKTVPAIAKHAFNNPSYIYNTDFLFTYGIINYYPVEQKMFYLVNYTEKPYTITKLDISTTWADQYIETYGEWLKDAIN